MRRHFHGVCNTNEFKETMRPIDFVVFDGDSSPNTPAHEIADAMMKPIEIYGPDGKYQILSYYYSGGCLVLDVERIENVVSRKKQVRHSRCN